MLCTLMARLLLYSYRHVAATTDHISPDAASRCPTSMRRICLPGCEGGCAASRAGKCRRVAIVEPRAGAALLPYHQRLAAPAQPHLKCTRTKGRDRSAPELP